MRLLDFPWIFELGAPIYNWFNSQSVWRESCAHLVAHFPRADMSAPPHPFRVLDLGCGPGNTVIEMARVRPDIFLVGLDLSPKMLEIAQKETEQAKLTPRIAYVRADATALPFPENALDVTTGHSFLYLVGDRAGVLRDSYRVLRKGGRWVSMEPRDGKTSNWVAKHWTNVRFMVSVILWRPYSKMHGRLDEQKFPETLARAGFKNNGTELAIEGLGIIGYGEK